MQMHITRPLAVVFLLLVPMLAGCTSSRMSQLIGEDVRILRTFGSAGAIDRDDLLDAKAVAVLGGGEGAMLVGAAGAEGILVRRLPGGWSPPLAVDLFGGSFGLQIGGQSREFVLLFMTEASIDRFVQDGRTPLARATATAGRTSGDASSRLPDDMIVLTRADGLFGSLALGGLGVRINDPLNRKTYGPVFTAQRVLSGNIESPPGTLVLWSMLKELESMGQPTR